MVIFLHIDYLRMEKVIPFNRRLFGRYACIIFIFIYMDCSFDHGDDKVFSFDFVFKIFVAFKYLYNIIADLFFFGHIFYPSYIINPTKFP